MLTVVIGIVLVFNEYIILQFHKYFCGNVLQIRRIAKDINKNNEKR